MKNNIKTIKFEKVIINGLNTKNDKDIKVGIYDILEDNAFSVVGSNEEYFDITLSLQENNLTFVITSYNTKINLNSVSFNIKSISKILKEYIILCNSYYESIKLAPIQKVEALDMGRRSLHDDASHILVNKLKEYIVMDFNTARRFIFVSDVSEAITTVLGRKGIEIFNVTGEKLITLEDIIKTGCEVLNFETKILEKDSKNFNTRDADNQLIKKQVGWSPKINLLLGTKEVINGFK